METKNKWEKLFDEFLDFTEFELVKYKKEDCEDDSHIWGLIDSQKANLGDIESDRFSDAESIFDRMEIYIEDYFIECIDNALDKNKLATKQLNEYQDYIDNAKPLLPDMQWEFEILDMICNHSNEIDLNNCCFSR